MLHELRNLYLNCAACNDWLHTLKTYSRKLSSVGHLWARLIKIPVEHTIGNNRKHQNAFKLQCKTKKYQIWNEKSLIKINQLVMFCIFKLFLILVSASLTLNSANKRETKKNIYRGVHHTDILCTCALFKYIPSKDACLSLNIIKKGFFWSEWTLNWVWQWFVENVLLLFITCNFCTKNSAIDQVISHEKLLSLRCFLFFLCFAFISFVVV